MKVPGATFVGVATALGISVHTLTTRLRDLSVLGDMRASQLDRIARECAACDDGSHRVVVMHHNPLAGEISKRFGFKRSHAARILERFAATGVDLVLCGHDHQEAVHFIERAAGGMVVLTAGTITTMSRGKRPTSVNVIEMDAAALVVRVMIWDTARSEFAVGADRRFPR